VPYFAGSIPYIDPQSHHPSELMMELFLTNQEYSVDIWYADHELKNQKEVGHRHLTRI
jgi:hypothetical protein